jgi:hypothetical protein
MECFGGGIRHTLSHKCIEDGHDGAKEQLDEIAKHKPGCAWVFYHKEARCSCFESDASEKR